MFCPRYLRVHFYFVNVRYSGGPSRPAVRRYSISQRRRTIFKTVAGYAEPEPVPPDPLPPHPPDPLPLPPHPPQPGAGVDLPLIPLFAIIRISPILVVVTKEIPRAVFMMNSFHKGRALDKRLIGPQLKVHP
jgi:hypothetical protein